MVTISSFLLRRLYVKGSLRNTGTGFQFELLNTLGSGYARRLLPLSVDGHEIPIANCAFQVNGRRCSFDAVSSTTPFTLELNKTTTVTVQDMNLSEEPHRIGMGFEVPGLGTLQFDFMDTPSDA